MFGLGDDKETDRTPSNVDGWLMGVHGYREPSAPYDNNMRYAIRYQDAREDMQDVLTYALTN